MVASIGTVYGVQVRANCSVCTPSTSTFSPWHANVMFPGNRLASNAIHSHYLVQLYPNPTSGEFTLACQMAEASLFLWTFFSITGQQLALKENWIDTGVHQFKVQDLGMAPDVYLLKTWFKDQADPPIKVVVR